MSVPPAAHLIELQDRFRTYLGGRGLIATGYDHWPLGQIATLLRIIGQMSTIRIDWRWSTYEHDVTCWTFEINRPARRALMALAVSSPRQRRLAAILPTLHDLLSVAPKASWVELRIPAPACPENCLHCTAYADFLTQQRIYWNAD